MRSVLLATVTMLATATVCREAFASHDKSLAIIGDSVATGAASSSNVDARFASLIKNFLTHGIRDPEGSQGGVNYPENAFSQIVASGFGVKPGRIVNLAVNGERVNSIASQFQKLGTIVANVPDFILVSFTANDACSEDIFSTSVDSFRATYLKSILEGDNGRAGLRYVARAAPSDRDTTVFLLASLNFPQVLTNPSILNHKVPLHFSKVRCERFRAGDHFDDPRFTFLADKLRQMCPAVLGTNPNGSDQNSIFRRQHLERIHRAIVETQQSAIEILNRENLNPHLKLRFIGSTARIPFDGRHVANDCFHLSNQGQGLLGVTAWEEIFNGL